MKHKLTELMNLDLGRLNAIGWLLLLLTLGVALGGIVLIVLATETTQGGSRRGPFRFLGFLCWAVAAGVFFGGRLALDAAGVSIYRRKKRKREAE